MKHVPTSIKVVDELCGGGLLANAVNTIYGDPSTAKTGLAMTIAFSVIEQQKDNAVKVVVIDTESGWSDTRIQKAAESRKMPLQLLPERLKRYSATMFGEQHKMIMDVIPMDLKENDWELGLIVVDSLVAFYHAQLLSAPTQVLASKSRELQGRLSLEINSLLKLATGYDAPVLLVTWTKSSASRSFNERERKELLEDLVKGTLVSDLECGLGSRQFDLIGGQHLTYMTKTMLHLASIKGDPFTKAITLEKSIEKPTYMGGLVKVTDKGVEDVKGSKPMPLNELMKEVALEGDKGA
jgi:KaiC/GvpD/RAD55 family RecA-like ATPase